MSESNGNSLVKIHCTFLLNILNTFSFEDYFRLSLIYVHQVAARSVFTSRCRPNLQHRYNTNTFICFTSGFTWCLLGCYKLNVKLFFRFFLSFVSLSFESWKGMGLYLFVLLLPTEINLRPHFDHFANINVWGSLLLNTGALTHIPV